MQGGISQDVYFTSETEILLVVGKELQVVAKVTSHINGIFYVVTIEGNRIFADRTGKRELQQSDLVFVNVDVGKHILQDHVQDVTRLKEMVDTRRVLSFDDVFLSLWILPIDMLANRFINRYGKHQLVIVGTKFHLV